MMEESKETKAFAMTSEKRLAVIKLFLETKCFPILDRKGKASSGGTADPNKGFDEAACSETGVDRYVVWWIYFMKQIIRLKTWVFHRKDVAETLDEMLADIVNYALIAVSMLVQDGFIKLASMEGRRGVLRRQNNLRVQIEWDNPDDPNWMTVDNLLFALQKACSPKTHFKIVDLDNPANIVGSQLPLPDPTGKVECGDG